MSESQKKTVEEILVSQKQRILVIIDDLDRLTTEEIRQVFRTIKAVANFPNVIYFLAFDKHIAINAIKKLQDISGAEYLEKIVQVPFELPLPDKASLQRLLFEKLDTILAGLSQDQFDSTHWGNVYFDGIDHFIDTPRDIVRLTNTLSMTYPAVRGEVNAVDFIAIEVLRVFCPLAYDMIRKNPDKFEGHSDAGRDSHHRDSELNRFHEAWNVDVVDADKEPVKKLLTRLFPKLEVCWGSGSHYGADWLSTWRKQLRICSPDIIPIHFRLAIPEGALSSAEMRAALALTKDAKAFGRKLVEFANQLRPDKTTRVPAFLERLEDYTAQDIPHEHIPSMVQALLDVGDQLLRPEDERRGLFGFGNDIRILRIIRQLLRRYTEPQRFMVLCDAIEGGRSLATIVHQVAVLDQEHGKSGDRHPPPEEERLVNGPHLAELEQLALTKIQAAAKNGSLLGTPSLPHILYRWRDWGEENDVKEWVNEALREDHGFLTFLEAFLQKGMSQFMDDRVGQITYMLDPQWLEPFLTVTEAVGHASNLRTFRDLTEKQSKAIDQFLYEYETRQQGKDPYDPLA